VDFGGGAGAKLRLGATDGNALGVELHATRADPAANAASNSLKCALL
jgi:hypothetical protein